MRRWSAVAGALVLDAGVAARILGPGLRRERDAARVNGQVLDGDLVVLLDWVERAERAEQTLRVPPAKPEVSQLPAGGFAAPASEEVTSTLAVAQRAGVSEQAVRQAARSGRLAGRQQGGRWEFTPAAVDRWIANRTKGT